MPSSPSTAKALASDVKAKMPLKLWVCVADQPVVFSAKAFFVYACVSVNKGRV